MSRITKPLTDTEIKATSTQDKDKSLYDGKGLILLIKKNGSKLWRYKYKHPVEDKMVMLGIGKYPAMTLTYSEY